MKHIYAFITIVFFILVVGSHEIYSQGVAINNSGNNADASAMLDIKSTNSGLLIPRMSSTERTGIISPATGLLVYQTNSPIGFYYNSGTPASPSWVKLSIPTDNFDDADADPTNELQTLSILDHTITLSGGGGSVTVPDNNTTYLAGNQLTLSGTTFNVSEGSGSGLDADLLDGNHASAFSLTSHAHTWSQITSKPAAWLDGSNLIETNDNFNNSKPSGFYQQYNGSNAPTSGTWYNMINVRHNNISNDHGFQIAASYYDENIWTRTYKGGTGNNDGNYTPWRALMHSGNLSSNAILNQTATDQSANFRISGSGTLNNLYNNGKIYLTRNAGGGNAAHGISWYSNAFVTWYDYMSPNGAGYAPNGTAAPTDAVSGVTSWARRFNIENNSGYGWIFESGPNNATAPTVKFSINSNNGNFHSVGNGHIDGDLSVNGSVYGVNYADVSNIPVRTSWVGVHRGFVAEQLSWKNYGNSHTIFDASQGTSPNGTAINNTNPNVNWSASYPTLMGWNGSNTYGVRVDVARYAESAGSAPGDNLGNHTATTNLNMNSNEIDNTKYYDVLAGNGNGVRFWQSDNYKINMGNGGEWAYGAVTGYSIKTNMNNDATRGWTWGVVGSTPVASINTQGNMQLARNLTIIGNEYINNTSPTIYLQDSDQRSGMIHMNSNLLYFLSGSGTNSTSWAINGSYWPLTIDMTNDVITFGGAANFMEGNVGIGTTSPGQKLQVNGKIASEAASTYFHQSSSGSYGSANGFLFGYSSGSVGVIIESGYSESGGFQANGDNANIWSPGDADLLRFYDEDGMILKAYINSSGSFITASDINKKQKIVKIDNALAKIQSINGYNFEFKLQKEEIEKGETPKKVAGVIAQEVEVVMPELVEQHEDDGLYVDYEGLIPYLIEAVKEQQKIIDIQQKQINKLQIQLSELEKLIKN